MEGEVEPEKKLTREEELQRGIAFPTKKENDGDLLSSDEDISTDEKPDIQLFIPGYVRLFVEEDEEEKEPSPCSFLIGKNTSSKKVG